MEFDMTTPRTFPADEVINLRHALDKTQGQLAEMLGVARSLVSHWEIGIRDPMGPAAILLHQLRSMALEKNLPESQ